MEQSLYGKYAISVTTYENYGGRDCAKVLNKLLTYSGATLCGTIAFRKKVPSNLLEKPRLTKKIQKTANRFRDQMLGGGEAMEFIGMKGSV